MKFQGKSMIPGQFLTVDGEIELNAGRSVRRLIVSNVGNRPIQVGSHYPYYDVNAALLYERELARGCRLDIPAGTAIRFEPGQAREVQVIPYAGTRHVYGGRAAIMGPLDGER